VRADAGPGRTASIDGKLGGHSQQHIGLGNGCNTEPVDRKNKYVATVGVVGRLGTWRTSDSVWVLKQQTAAREESDKKRKFRSE